MTIEISLYIPEESLISLCGQEQTVGLDSDTPRLVQGAHSLFVGLLAAAEEVVNVLRGTLVRDLEKTAIVLQNTYNGFLGFKDLVVARFLKAEIDFPIRPQRLDIPPDLLSSFELLIDFILTEQAEANLVDNGPV